MDFISPELFIREIKQSNTTKRVLYFQFKGKFSKNSSVEGSKHWTNELEKASSQTYEFIWNCTEMTGFELSARKEWYDAMQGFKQQISKVYVVSDRIMIRSAAKVMLQFFGIANEIVRSEQELPVSIQP